MFMAAQEVKMNLNKQLEKMRNTHMYSTDTHKHTHIIFSIDGFPQFLSIRVISDIWWFYQTPAIV